MLRFKEIDHYTSYELEFVLFGLSYEEQKHLTEGQKENLNEAHGSLYADVRFNDLDLKTFIEKIKMVIKHYKNIVIEKVEKKQNVNGL